MAPRWLKFIAFAMVLAGAPMLSDAKVMYIRCSNYLSASPVERKSIENIFVGYLHGFRDADRMECFRSQRGAIESNDHTKMLCSRVDLIGTYLQRATDSASADIVRTCKTHNPAGEQTIFGAARQLVLELIAGRQK